MNYVHVKYSEYADEFSHVLDYVSAVPLLSTVVPQAAPSPLPTFFKGTKPPSYDLYSTAVAVDRWGAAIDDAGVLGGADGHVLPPFHLLSQRLRGRLRAPHRIAGR